MKTNKLELEKCGGGKEGSVGGLTKTPNGGSPLTSVQSVYLGAQGGF